MTEPTITPFVSIWTGDDTAEAGPTVDEKGASWMVEEGGVGTKLLHIATDDGSVGLWTVAMTLPTAEAQRLAVALTKSAFADRNGALLNLSSQQLDALERFVDAFDPGGNLS